MSVNFFLFYLQSPCILSWLFQIAWYCSIHTFSSCGHHWVGCKQLHPIIKKWTLNCWERHDPNEPHVRGWGGGWVLFIFSIYKLCTIHMTNGKTISNLLNNLVFTFQYTTFFKINLYIPIYLYYNSKVQTLKIRTRLGGGSSYFVSK